MPFEFQQLRYFNEVADAHSIKSAARRLNIAQSALSRRMQQLEFDLGVRLFDRRHDGVALTEAGRRLQVGAAELIAQFDRLRAEFGVASGDSNELALGVTRSAASLILGPLTRQLAEAMPGSKLRVVEATNEQLREAVLKGDIDLALVTNGRANRMLQVVQLWRETIFLVAPPAFADRPRLAIADLVHLPFVLTTRSATVRRQIERTFRRAGYPMTVAMEMDAISTVTHLVGEGRAFTILPYPMISAEAAAGHVAVAPLAGCAITRGLMRRASWPPNGNERRLIACLFAELERQLASLPWAERLPGLQVAR